MRCRLHRVLVASLVMLTLLVFGAGATHAGSSSAGAHVRLGHVLNSVGVAATASQTVGSVTVTQACTPLTIKRDEVSRCEVEVANSSFVSETVDLDTSVTKELDIVGSEGATILDRGHAQAHGITLAGAEAGVPSVAPGSVAGYLPLDLFGVTPVPIGDEDILNFTVPSFEYAGQTWNQIGVDSNGYIVVGGGTSEDNNCCNLPSGPDPARPNNVLAPFWTDLDGTGAPGIYAATLTDGVNTWVVVEFRVNVFGTISSRVFQVWIGINGVEDITYAYDPANLPANPNGQDFLVGAENAVGQGEMSQSLPTEDLRVSTSAPTPGEVATYAVYVQGRKHGTGTVTTGLVASAGTTVVSTQIEVLKKKL